MERGEDGRALAKYGRCGICGKRVSALADEDFECCEEDYNRQEEEEEIYEPARKLVTSDNHDKVTFTVKDMVMAMIGVGWKDIKTLWYELRSIGFDYVMMIDKDDLVAILEDLEVDDFIEVYWDTERVRRIERE